MHELTCPSCGAAMDLDDAPAEKMHQQLAALIDGGTSPDDAVDVLVATFPADGGEYARASVRVVAHRIARSRDRATEKAVIGSPQRFAQANEVLRKRLLEGTFSLGGGNKVTWGKATPGQHQERRKLLVEQQTGIDATVRRHDLAIELIASTPGATCLDDVDGGHLVLVDDAAASAEVVSELGEGAREELTSADVTPVRHSRRGRRRAA